MTNPPSGRGQPHHPRRSQPTPASMPGLVTMSSKPAPSGSLIAIGVTLLLLGGVIAAWGTHDYIENLFWILDGREYGNPTAVPIVIGGLLHLAGWITAAVGGVRAAQGVDYLVKAHTPSAVRRTPRRPSPPPST